MLSNNIFYYVTSLPPYQIANSILIMNLLSLFFVSIFFSLIFPLSVFANERNDEKGASSVHSPDNRLYTANFLDAPPQFRGGPAALQQYIDTYLTQKFARIDYEGIIMLRFEIDTLGFVDNLVAVGEEKGSLVYEACEKVQHTRPRWLPGMLNGEKVRSVYSLPVVFVVR